MVVWVNLFQVNLEVKVYFLVLKARLPKSLKLRLIYFYSFLSDGMVRNNWHVLRLKNVSIKIGIESIRRSQSALNPNTVFGPISLVNSLISISQKIWDIGQASPGNTGQSGEFWR